MLPGFERADDAPGRTQSLYRKYRPTTFESDELVGQEHVSRTLRNAIVRGRVAHAYLFCGPRGTGKTSTARLLAKAVNCLDPDPAQRPCNHCEACLAIGEGRTTDIVEIDAASNRGIDDIRNLREAVKYAPTQLRTKFYIIDEAHQITRDAFNAFLKTLEEPPPNTTFVLATTDPDKLPETIASRCQRFDFRRIPVELIAGHLRRIAEREDIAIDDEAVSIVARQATGSMRDAESMLDLLATAALQEADGPVDAELARRMLGLSQDDRAIDLVRAIAARDVKAGLVVIGEAVDAGQDMRAFGRHVLGLLRVLMLVKAGARPPEATEDIEGLAEGVDLPSLLRINQHFSEVDYAIRNGGFPQLPLELALVASVIEPAAAAPAPSPAAVSQPRRVERASSLAERPAPPRQRPETPPAPPLPRVAEHQSAPAPAQAAPLGASLAEVVALWERIRTEVRAIDRKAEALLASTDPHGFDGKLLVLVAAYPFHVGKLNEPRMRQTIEDAASRILGGPIQVEVILRSDVAAQAAPPVTENGSGAATMLAEPVIPYPDETDQPEQESERLRMAKTILDAREII